jgi:hypothetical protein
MMTQLFLKPGVLGPVPIDVGKILAMVRTAVRLALQEDELPVAQLLLSSMISCDAHGVSPVSDLFSDNSMESTTCARLYGEEKCCVFDGFSRLSE